MKLLFAHKAGSGVPVSDSGGRQEVIASLIDDGDQIVVLLDSSTNGCYVERVISKFDMDMMRSGNLAKIEDDEAWKRYKEYFVAAGIMPGW